MKNYRDVSSLKEWDKNPRVIREDDYEQLRKQVQELGMFKPVLILEDGTVIGGNMRLKVYRELGYTKIWVSVLDLKPFGEGWASYLDGEMVSLDGKAPARVYASREEAIFLYAMADNNRAGETKKDLVKRLLEDYRISDKDMSLKIDFGKGTPIRDLKRVTEAMKPEIQFTPELLHENNYVVFTFENVLDWNVIVKTFGIEAVKALDSKEDYFRAGVGRVVDGKKLLEKLK